MCLSELLAEVEWSSEQTAHRLPEGNYQVQGLCPQQSVKLRARDGLGIHLLRMPYCVNHRRLFEHRGYYLEYQGRPIPVTTDAAWRIGDRDLCFS
jgi:CRISPR-associated protein Cas5h